MQMSTVLAVALDEKEKQPKLFRIRQALEILRNPFLP